ncbi:hypothetical protein CDO73_09610 [Saccharibacillus sp. O23]|uniref:S-layer homology domain-containing protein n=1 Tax=Saccharibacillus sp. O23 TaxID=2009338 RepID=UPI000B4E782D|nr:S-layer homology domain-containing protein [Saccharibacillus sp. O23]OWR30834.1 hypothetical protein CDO73_09610 [Saccharibacillus sp. O23]
MSKKGKAGKTAFTGILSLGLALGTIGTAGAAAPSASDIRGHWAEAQIQQWLDQGNLQGYADGTVKPNGTISRAEFAAMVNRLFGYKELANTTFKDVPAANWAFSDVSKAVQAGYIVGSGGTFRPAANVTREEAAVMVARILGLDTKSTGALSVFADADRISSWSQGSVAAAVQKGIFKGNSDGSFAPQRALTRAEAIVLLNAAYANKAVAYDKAGTYGPEKGMTVIEGDVVISAAGVTLRNTEVKGNLLLAEGIGSGDVTLNGVRVHGTTNVQGGGANSIHFVDSVLVNIVVNKQNGMVRIVAEGSTTTASVVVQSPVKLEEKGVSGVGFTDVELAAQLPKGAQVTLDGTFDTLDVKAAALSVQLTRGTVGNVQVGAEATGTSVEVADGATVARLVLDAVVKLLGNGTIQTAVVNETAAGSSFVKAPASVQGSAATSVTLPAAPAATTPAPAPSTGGSTGGGSTTPSNPAPSVSKTALNTAIAAADKEKEASYTPSSWKTFGEALTAAKSVSASASATQTQIDAAASKLTTAQKALVARADKAELNAAIEAAVKIEAEGYKPSTWLKFQDALKQAVEASEYADATQEEVNAALDKLTQAQEGLEKLAGKEGLTIALNETKSLNEGDYTTTSWSNLQTVIAAAKTVAADQEASEADVTLAIGKLTTATGQLVNVKQLNAAIKEAGTLVETDYTPATWTAFDEALTAAKTVAQDQGATKEEVAAAVQKLASASGSLLERAVKTELNTAIQATGSIKAEGYKPSTWLKFQDALKQAVEASEYADATQEEVNAALDKLTQAQEGLEELAGKEGLTAALKDAKLLNEDDYTVTTWNNLQTVIAAAKIVEADEEASEANVTQAIAKLTTATSELVSVKQLNAAIEAAGALVDTDYTPATWTAFKTALTEAAEVSANADATQVEVNAALKNLADAQNELKAPADKTALQALLTAIEQKDLEAADYTEASWKVFADALDAAKGIVANANASQLAVDQAKTDLESAQDQLTFKTDLTELNQSISAAKALSDKYAAQIGVNTGQVSQTAYDAFAQTIEAAEAVKSGKEPSAEAVNQAVTALTEATTALQSAVVDYRSVSTLEELQDAAKFDGNKIRLSADIEATSTVMFKDLKKIELDGAGKTITFNDDKKDGAQLLLWNVKAANVHDLKVSGSANYNIHVYLSDASFRNVTSQQSKKAGMLVNGSKATIENFATASNAWGGIEVSQGKDVTAASELVLAGTNALSENVAIWTINPAGEDAMNLVSGDVSGYAVQPNAKQDATGTYTYYHAQDQAWQVSDEAQLRQALSYENAKIVLTADISIADELNIDKAGIEISGAKTDGTYALTVTGKKLVVLGADNVNIHDLKIANKANVEGKGEYALQVYNSTGVKLNNVTLTSEKKGGLHVNGSEVEINGIHTLNNAWGGIEVSQGVDAPNPAKLTVTGINTHDDNGKTPIWIDPNGRTNDASSVVDQTGQYLSYHPQDKPSFTYYQLKNTVISTSSLSEFKQLIAIDGAQIELTGDLVITEAVSITGQNVMIDGKGHKIDVQGAKFVVLQANGVGMRDMTITNSSEYALQVYNSEGIVLDNLTLTGVKKGGLHINGSKVKTNNLNTVGNLWGGIEVSQGVDAPNPSELTLLGKNTHQDQVDVAIWIDPANSNGQLSTVIGWEDQYDKEEVTEPADKKGFVYYRLKTAVESGGTSGEGQNGEGTQAPEQPAAEGDSSDATGTSGE